MGQTTRLWSVEDRANSKQAESRPPYKGFNYEPACGVRMSRTGQGVRSALIWDLVLPITTGVGFYLMISYGTIKPSNDDLPAFFGIAMQILATGLVALALISAFPARVGYVLLRPITLLALVWLSLGVTASTLGAMNTEASPLRPALTSLTLSSLAVFLSIVLRVASRNLKAQIRSAEIELATGNSSSER